MLRMLQLFITLAERPGYKVKNKGHQSTTNDTLWGWKLEIPIIRRERQSKLFKVRQERLRLAFFKCYKNKHKSLFMGKNELDTWSWSWLQVSEPYQQMLSPPWRLGTVTGKYSLLKKSSYFILVTLVLHSLYFMVISAKWLLKKSFYFIVKVTKWKVNL